MLDVVSTLVEGPGQVLAAALLLVAGHKQRPYERLRHDNATEIVRAAQDKNELTPLLRGLDPHLRNAYAHNAVSYDGTVLVTDLRSESRRVAFEDLIDGAFEAQESVLACLLGLNAALAERDIVVEDGADFGASFGLSDVDVTTLIVSLFNYPVQTVSVEEGSWLVELDMPDDSSMMELVASVIPCLPGDAADLTLFNISGMKRLAGPVDLVRRWLTESDEILKGIRFIQLLHAWTMNEERCVSDVMIRKWVALRAQSALTRGYPEGLAELRELRTFATGIGDSELENALRGLTRHMRLAGTGHGPSELQAFRELVRWARQAVDFAPV